MFFYYLNVIEAITYWSFSISCFYVWVTSLCITMIKKLAKVVELILQAKIIIIGLKSIIFEIKIILTFIRHIKHISIIF